jgi:hypothetical protein
MHHGTCLCEGIQYEIHEELSDFGYCHCRSCRKASGSAHGANAGFDRSNLKLSDPDQLLREYESSAGKIRAFCSNCGSPLFAYLTRSSETMRVRLGTLDSSFSKRARAHTFVADKADWEAIGDDLPQFDAWASKDVLVQAGSRQP